jgi:hypothetical protein
VRWLPFAVVGAVLFALALSDDVYNVTSPPHFSGHVALRKLYSVIAFACVGAAYRYARRRSGIVETAAAIGLYSGLIEIGQWFTSEESLPWNLIDVACGILGGGLAAAILNRVAAARGR